MATFTYDAAGRLTQADDTADPHRPIAMTYDALDRLLTETTTLGTVSYTYDTAGRRTTMTVSGQTPVSYTYDANSRLRTITQAPLNPVDLQYDAAGRRTLLTLPNGVSTEYQYDLGSRLTALIYRNALGPLGDLQHGYNAAGNRTSVGGSFARTLLPDAVASATYDQGNRQLAFGAYTMSLDDNGNLLTQTDPSGTITYTWDARNRLTGLAGPSVSARFAYDALGRRAQKTVGSVTTEFLYDGLDIVKETGGAGDASYLRTLAIDEALTRTDATDTTHYLADALGSTVALTNPAGAAATTYTYEPFGRTEVGGTPSPNEFQFTGRGNDGTGLYFYRNRYHSPSLHSLRVDTPRLAASSCDRLGKPGRCILWVNRDVASYDSLNVNRDVASYDSLNAGRECGTRPFFRCQGRTLLRVTPERPALIACPRPGERLSSGVFPAPSEWCHAAASVPDGCLYRAWQTGAQPG